VISLFGSLLSFNSLTVDSVTGLSSGLKGSSQEKEKEENRGGGNWLTPLDVEYSC